MLLSSSGECTSSPKALLSAAASEGFCTGVPSTASQNRPRTSAALGSRA